MSASKPSWSPVAVLDHRGVNLIPDVLLFGQLWYGETNAASNAIGYAKFFSRSRQASAKYAQDLGKPRDPSAHKIGFRITSMVFSLAPSRQSVAVP
jgi:hypothetical protein